MRRRERTDTSVEFAPRGLSPAAIADRLNGERGSPMLETLILLPIALIVLTGGLQLTVAASSVISAQNAARAGARAAAVGGDGTAVAQASLPGWIDASVTSGGTSVTVTVAVPSTTPMLSDGFVSLSRSAEFPEADGVGTSSPESAAAPPREPVARLAPRVPPPGHG